MSTPKISDLSDRELLLLLNQQVSQLEKKFDKVCKNVDERVRIADQKVINKKVDIMWDRWNRVIGIAIGAGLIAGGTGGTVASLIVKAFGGQ